LYWDKSIYSWLLINVSENLPTLYGRGLAYHAVGMYSAAVVQC